MNTNELIEEQVRLFGEEFVSVPKLEDFLRSALTKVAESAREEERNIIKNKVIKAVGNGYVELSTSR